MSFYRRIQILYRVDQEQVRNIIISLAMFSGATYQEAVEYAKNVDKQGIQVKASDSR